MSKRLKRVRAALEAAETATEIRETGNARTAEDAAAAPFGAALIRTDADTVRQKTGFAIGGVAPVGHLPPPMCFLEPALMEFTQVWAAAGTPRPVFAIAPKQLHNLTGARIADFVKKG